MNQWVNTDTRTAGMIQDKSSHSSTICFRLLLFLKGWKCLCFYCMMQHDCRGVCCFLSVRHALSQHARPVTTAYGSDNYRECLRSGPWLITGRTVVNNRCESPTQRWWETPWAKCRNVALMYDIFLAKERDSRGSAADMENILYTLPGHSLALGTENAKKHLTWTIFKTPSLFVEWKITSD